jgi:NSS family neurotransmitter:Na+ symporter
LEKKYALATGRTQRNSLNLGHIREWFDLCCMQGTLLDPSMTNPVSKKDGWNSRIGVILAVAGSAVGIGNFLRFPGKAAEYGGGAFMIAYLVAFLLIGLPICWSEWAMGRHGGKKGFNTAPGIFTVFSKSRLPKYFGVIALVIPIVIYMYYVYIESWCLGYAVNYLLGNMHFESVESAGVFFGQFTGIGADGSALGFAFDQVGIYLILVFLLNFFLISRGLSKGIEFFCKFAMPTLLIIAVIILVRVLTLGIPDVAKPENSVANGLGFMWNPTKVHLEESVMLESGKTVWRVREQLVGDLALERGATMASASESLRVTEVGMLTQLKNPQLWLEAAGQIFFSLSVGFGIILTYASYLKGDSDVVLSGLTATSTNEFCEVGLGGLITLPAAVAFLGVAGLAGAGMSTFSLGFNVLPMVFSEMVGGQFFGFLFFFLLFLAAVTSSLSMLQPGIAFLEEALVLNRKQSVAILGVITAMGTMFVVYFSESLKALDTLDFWVGTFLIYILATLQIIMFGWVWGTKEGLKEAAEGSTISIPMVFGFIMKWITPVFLLTVFALFLAYSIFGIDGTESGYINDLFGEYPNKVAWLSVSVIALLAMFFTLMISGVQKYKDFHKTNKGSS